MQRHTKEPKKALKRLEDHGFKFEEVESAELQEGSDVTLESYIQTENSSWARQIKHLRWSTLYRSCEEQGRPRKIHWQNFLF